MPFATLQEFLARLDSKWIFELTVERHIEGDEPTVEELAKRDARCTTALEDASAELLGLINQLPAGKRPDAETLRVHCVRVTLHMLTQNRPGGEFAAIRKAYDDTIAFYTRIIDAGNAAGGGTPTDASHEAPAPVFTDDTLKGFV